MPIASPIHHPGNRVGLALMSDHGGADKMEVVPQYRLAAADQDNTWAQWNLHLRKLEVGLPWR